MSNQMAALLTPSELASIGKMLSAGRITNRTARELIHAYMLLAQVQAVESRPSREESC